MTQRAHSPTAYSHGKEESRSNGTGAERQKAKERLTAAKRQKWPPLRIRQVSFSLAPKASRTHHWQYRRPLIGVKLTLASAPGLGAGTKVLTANVMLAKEQPYQFFSAPPQSSVTHFPNCIALRRLFPPTWASHHLPALLRGVTLPPKAVPKSGSSVQL